jgi:PKD repeat protein
MLLFLLAGCLPDRDESYTLPGGELAPAFTLEALASNPNKFLITDLTKGSFQRVWDIPGGIPKTTDKQQDTILFSKAGTYTVTLYSSASDGSGTAFVKKTITVAQDAPLSCTPVLALLTGDCQPGGKCWTLSNAAGAVKVGPTYDDFSWYTSPAGGLQSAQYDDRFCFTFQGLVFENRNSGTSVNPWDGYKVVPYNPGKSDFTLLEGTGISGRNQLRLQDNQFMGVWDADNLLDIVKLTADQLIVRTRIRAQNGTPNPEGWFELTFVKSN